ncbi:MAG: hypothetical protein ACYTHJ_07355 [Planctomycetota bacterium]
MRSLFQFRSTVVVVAFMSVNLAQAQWADDAAENLALADRSGEQVQAKIRILDDGSSYVSWFDNSTGGYDVYLQRLDAGGNELWAHNGVLLADRGFSSTQDYDLDVDTAGNALVTFRDDRVGGTQITVTRVDTSGVQLWGPTGVQVTSGGSFVAAPKVSGTSDGNVVVAWTSDNDVRLQKLDTAGLPLWGAGVLIPAIGGDSTSASDMDASDGGGVIISMVRGFLAPKHLHAQKYDGSGAPQWGLTPLPVYDGGALQTANFPQFVPDGIGGAAFAWYSVGPLQVHAQHVTSDGTEQYGHNGVIVSTAARPRTAPSVSFDATAQETTVFWREELGGPFPEYGVYGQRLNSSGARLWTDSGVEVAPLTTTELVQIDQAGIGSDAVVSWVETLSFGNQLSRASKLDSSGGIVWGPVLVSSVNSGKSRQAVAGVPLAAAVDGSAVVIWSDSRNDANDVYAQNLNGNGSLGISSPAIPAVSDWGMLILLLAVLSVGTGVIMTRRRHG